MKRLANRLFAALLPVLVLFVAAPAGAVEIRRVVSPGGIEAWLVEHHANPIVSLRIAFRGGAALDPAGKEGLANMVASTIDEGAGDLDSQAFQGTLTDRSISLSFDANRDSFGGELEMLTERMEEGFRLLRLALTEPRFDAEPVGRIRDQIQAILRRDLERPGVVSDLALMAALFPDHPYGRPVKGTPESVAAITDADLRAFVGRRFGRDNLLIGVVGDVTPETLGPLLDATFGALPAQATAWDVAEVTPRTTGALTVVRKDVPQSSISFAQVGLKRNDPDFYAAYVLNHVVGGGGFTSRLYDEVREKRGLAYSVSTGLYALDHAGLILGDAGTANARVGETVDQIRAQWRQVAEAGVTAAEIDDAKTYLTGSYPLRFSSNGRIAGMLVGIQLDRLGIDYFDKRNAYVSAVTPADVARVAKRLIDPAALTFVIAGQPEGIEATN